MTTIDLKQSRITIEELLHLAADEVVVIIDEAGREFMLEETDEFEKEVLALGQSEDFITFLKERAKEPAVASLDEVEQELATDGA